MDRELAPTLVAIAGPPLFIAAVVYWWTRSKPPTPDSMLLARLKRGGADLSAVHRVEFYVIARDEAEAVPVFHALQREGLEVDVERIDEEAAWVVVVTRAMVPSEPQLVAFGEWLQARAEAHGAEYGGWSTVPVQSVRVAAAKVAGTFWLLVIVGALGLTAGASVTAWSAMFLLVGLPLFVITARDLVNAVDVKS